MNQGKYRKPDRTPPTGVFQSAPLQRPASPQTASLRRLQLQLPPTGPGPYIFLFLTGAFAGTPHVILFVVCMHPASHLQAVPSGLLDENNALFSSAFCRTLADCVEYNEIGQFWNVLIFDGFM